MRPKVIKSYKEITRSKPYQEGDRRINQKTGILETYSPEGKWVPVYKGEPWTPPSTENKTNRESEWGIGNPFKKKYKVLWKK